jgi:NAD+ kinase
VAAVALFVHQTQAEAARLARDASDWLIERGHTVRLLPEDAAVVGLEHLVVPADELVDDLDLAVSLGGDGTMLRTVDLVADAGVPVLGVNLGHLGYLAEVEPGHLTHALHRFFAGDYGIEERMRLVVALEGERKDVYPALNEAVVAKNPSGQITRLLVTIDGEPFTTYSADGLIIATPTGSTAYVWSAGGPIVAPSHQAIVLTPVAPHMLFDRSLVLPPTACVRVEVADHRSAQLSVDGRSLAVLEDGDAITCTAAPCAARLVTMGPRSFLQILKAKFGLSEG